MGEWVREEKEHTNHIPKKENTSSTFAAFFYWSQLRLNCQRSIFLTVPLFLFHSSIHPPSFSFPACHCSLTKIHFWALACACYLYLCRMETKQLWEFFAIISWNSHFLHNILVLNFYSFFPLVAMGKFANWFYWFICWLHTDITCSPAFKDMLDTTNIFRYTQHFIFEVMLEASILTSYKNKIADTL